MVTNTMQLMTGSTLHVAILTPPGSECAPYAWVARFEDRRVRRAELETAARQSKARERGTGTAAQLYYSRQTHSYMYIARHVDSKLH
jgi:hypothetical protein